MVAKISLKAKKREVKGEKENSGMMPAVMYGPELKENKILWINRQDFKKIYDEVGESSLIDIQIEGEKDSHEVIIYDVQVDPIDNRYIHADFFKVKRGQKIETEVELVFIGESPAVKEAGAILVKSIDNLEIRCLPKDLPKEIAVDISALKNIEDIIYVKDIKIPEGVEVLQSPETVVAIAEAPRTEEELKGLDEKVETDMDKVGDVEKKNAEDETVKESVD
ncbi:MAG: 50S ribosomal protein L25 [Candidatus Moranbacteria bacterium]|jgi:large subunit ribosomal protein L25|nr:50S ribosomal protein L25 [Candidatus Moranbacteria bacterium]